MKNKKLTSSTSFLQKRLVFVDHSTDDKQLSQEEGLEKPEVLNPEDSQQEFLKLLQNVYTIEDSDVFLETYGDFIIRTPEDQDPEKLPDPENAKSLLRNPNGGKKLRDLAFKKLVFKFSSRVSEKGRDEINALPIKPETEEVTQQAHNELLKIREHSKNPEMYSMLAESIGTMGMKKEDLIRTNKLHENKQNIEQQLSTTNARLKILEDHKNELNAFEKTSRNTSRKWDSFKTSIINLVAPVAVGGGVGAGVAGAASYLALGIAMSTPMTAVAVGSVALGSFAGLGIKTLVFPNFGRYFSSQLRDRNSIALKSKLLKKGNVSIKKGESLVQFRVPPSPLVDGTTRENVIMVAPGGTIDGRIVKKAGGEPASGGSIVTGEVLENTELQLGFKVKDLTAQAARESQSLSLANAELSKHNTQMSLKSKNFQEKYDFLKKKIKSYEATVQKSTLHLAAIGTSRDKRDISDEENAEAEKSQAELAEAQAALKDARDALAVLKKVERVFTLNDELKKDPVPQGMLESLYSQSLNPDLLKITQKFAKEQDQNTTEAQKKLGSLTTKKLKELTQGLDGASMVEIKKYLKYIQKNWGMKGRTDLKIKFPILKKLEGAKPELFNILMSVSELTENTRYPKGPKDFDGDLVDKLLSMLGENAQQNNDIDNTSEDQSDGASEIGDISKDEIRTQERLKAEIFILKGQLSNIPHLKGINDILDTNPNEVRKIIRKGIEKGLHQLVVGEAIKSDFSPNHFSYYIDNLNDKFELKRWVKRLEFIKKYTIVKQLDRTGKVVDKEGTRTMETIPEMSKKVKKAAGEMMKKINEGRRDSEKISWKDLSLVNFRTDRGQALKDATRTDAILNQFTYDGEPKYNNKALEESDNVKYLELLEFTFNNLARLLKDKKLAVTPVPKKTHEFQIVPRGELPKESDPGEKEFFYELGADGSYQKHEMISVPQITDVVERGRLTNLLFSDNVNEAETVNVRDTSGNRLIYVEKVGDILSFYSPDTGRNYKLERIDFDKVGSDYLLES